MCFIGELFHKFPASIQRARLWHRQYRQVISAIRPWIPLIKARKRYTLPGRRAHRRTGVFS